MKKRVSKPPSSSQSVRGHEQQAAGDDVDLADGVALPAAERLRVEDARFPLNAVESVVAKQKRLQSEGAPQHEPGLTRPSGSSVRPP